MKDKEIINDLTQKHLFYSFIETPPKHMSF